MLFKFSGTMLCLSATSDVVKEQAKLSSAQHGKSTGWWLFRLNYLVGNFQSSQHIRKLRLDSKLTPGKHNEHGKKTPTKKKKERR